MPDPEITLMSYGRLAVPTPVSSYSVSVLVEQSAGWCRRAQRKKKSPRTSTRSQGRGQYQELAREAETWRMNEWELN